MAHTRFYNPSLVVVISGPSGSGKSTVIDALCKTDPTLRFAVSATTRKPRPDEVEGTDYHFLSKTEFKQRIQQGEFLEWAEYGGNLYGTPKTEIAAAHNAGQDTVLEIEIKGALQIRAQNLAPARSLLLFILPPSFAVLEKRLRRRNTESETELARRLNIAKSELTQIQHYDYCIINPDSGVAEAVQQIQTVITAERSRIDTELTKIVIQKFGIT